MQISDLKITYKVKIQREREARTTEVSYEVVRREATAAAVSGGTAGVSSSSSSSEQATTRRASISQRLRTIVTLGAYISSKQ